MQQPEHIATDMPLSLDQCSALVAGDMQRVDELIRQRLQSDVVLVNQLAGYIIGSGGKRLRPQLVLQAAGACGYTGQHHLTVAAIIEFIHTATLLHDDVVDASNKRRGRDTANAVWGNEAAVLVGDFLYSRSFEMMVDVESMRVMDILARTTNRIAEGEVMQLLNVNDPDLTEEKYIEVIEAKTARLFQAATQLGAVLADQPDEVRVALAEYGNKLGTAFQIVDDVLDYQSDAKAIGKNVGDDLAEGKTTLPLIYAMRDGTAAERELVAKAITDDGLDALPGVLDAIKNTQAIEKSLATAQNYAAEAADALLVLPETDYRSALSAIATYSVKRRA